VGLWKPSDSALATLKATVQDAKSKRIGTV